MEWFEMFLNDPIWYCVKIIGILCIIGIITMFIPIINSYLTNKNKS